MNRFLLFLIFIAGLAVACWIGAGYVGSNPLALAVTALIVAVYLAGALELYRYQQATDTLKRALADLSETPGSVDAWLGGVPQTLRVAVSRRISGERSGLPRPVLTPYLVGLLILLGMLGTFLGMVATLRGTGLALESATDLAAIRASLAAPVKGLGFAFGTSVAGVATSAMLGLLSALCSMDRIRAAQALDARSATTLRAHSPAHRREEGLEALRRQTEGMGALADKLQAMMTAMEAREQRLAEALATRQNDFHVQATAAYTRLAESVDQSLKESVADGARAAGAAMEPLVQTTMAGMTRDAELLRGTIAEAVERQLDGLSAHFRMVGDAARDIWDKAMAEHRQAHASLVQELRLSNDQLAQTLEQRSTVLLDGVAARLEETSNHLSQTWNAALARHEQAGTQAAKEHQHALTATLSSMDQQASGLLRTMSQSHEALGAALAAQDEQRLQAWAGTLRETSTQLRKDWERAGEQAAERQREAAAVLAQTADAVSVQAKAHADQTIAEIARLADLAGEAPKAAAELVAQVRQAFSDSMARDNAMLDERNRLLETLATLLEAVNHAASEQRGAVDAMLSRSADVMETVGSRFSSKVEAETGKLGQLAAQVTDGVVDISGLGQAFAAAIQEFGQSNAALSDQLQRIEAALNKSMTRSDEQLAYYVAQAKEVIDLSMMSQKQIIEELRQMDGSGPSAEPVTA